ncbi:hypothetical protein AgCh_037152 [Apium graveolens]
MSSTNTRVGNDDADVASSQKRRKNTHKVKSSSNRVALELFSTHNELVLVKTQEDPFDRLFKSQYEETRESCKHYLNNKYNDLMRQADERVSMICMEKDVKMARMKSKISFLQAMLAYKNELINNQNTQLDNSRRRNIELEEQEVQSKSQAKVWKEKARSAEEVLWNMSPVGQAPCFEEDDDMDDEVMSLSSVGGP